MHGTSRQSVGRARYDEKSGRPGEGRGGKVRQETRNRTRQENEEWISRGKKTAEEKEKYHQGAKFRVGVAGRKRSYYGERKTQREDASE